MKLYEYGPTRSARCRWLLQELELPFESVVVNLGEGEHRSEAYLCINPYGRVPALVDGDLVLTESVAICLYLADKYAEKGLIPEPGTPQRGLHDQWLLFCAVELDQALWRVHCHLSIYPEKKRRPEVAQLGREAFSQAAKIFNEALQEKTHLVGTSFTVADIVLCHTLVWASWYDLLEAFPNLQRYQDEHKKRPACPEALL